MKIYVMGKKIWMKEFLFCFIFQFSSWRDCHLVMVSWFACLSKLKSFTDRSYIFWRDTQVRQVEGWKPDKVQRLDTVLTAQFLRETLLQTKKNSHISECPLIYISAYNQSCSQHWVKCAVVQNRLAVWEQDKDSCVIWVVEVCGDGLVKP